MYIHVCGGLIQSSLVSLKHTKTNFMMIRAGPETEKWENLNGTKFFLLSLTIKNDLEKSVEVQK